MRRSSVTALVVLAVLNCLAWGVFIGALVGIRLSAYMRPEQRTTALVTTKVWLPRSSDRSTKIGA